MPSSCMCNYCLTRISKDGDFPMASHAPLFLTLIPSSHRVQAEIFVLFEKETPYFVDYM